MTRTQSGRRSVKGISVFVGRTVIHRLQTAGFAALLFAAVALLLASAEGNFTGQPLLIDLGLLGGTAGIVSLTLARYLERRSKVRE